MSGGRNFGPALITRIGTVPGVERVEASDAGLAVTWNTTPDTSALLRVLVDGAGEVEEVTARKQSLEDAFLKLVKDEPMEDPNMFRDIVTVIRKELMEMLSRKAGFKGGRTGLLIFAGVFGILIAPSERGQMADLDHRARRLGLGAYPPHEHRRRRFVRRRTGAPHARNAPRQPPCPTGPYSWARSGPPCPTPGA